MLASAFQNTRLTGPNDVVVKSDGSIWFSDNGAGIRGNYLGDKAKQEMPFRVYRLNPTSGELRIAVFASLRTSVSPLPLFKGKGDTR